MQTKIANATFRFHYASGQKEELPLIHPDNYWSICDTYDYKQHAYALPKNPPECINLGTGHGYSILEVIEAAKQVTGREIPYRIEPARAGDPSRLVADPAKAKAVLGWTPLRSDLHSILKSQADWKRMNPKGYAAK